MPLFLMADASKFQQILVVGSGGGILNDVGLLLTV
jgi:hypothetical protein